MIIIIYIYIYICGQISPLDLLKPLPGSRLKLQATAPVPFAKALVCMIGHCQT